jgi:hypothetical protein
MFFFFFLIHKEVVTCTAPHIYFLSQGEIERVCGSLCVCMCVYRSVWKEDTRTQVTQWENFHTRSNYTSTMEVAGPSSSSSYMAFEFGLVLPCPPGDREDPLGLVILLFVVDVTTVAISVSLFFLFSEGISATNPDTSDSDDLLLTNFTLRCEGVPLSSLVDTTEATDDDDDAERGVGGDFFLELEPCAANLR